MRAYILWIGSIFAATPFLCIKTKSKNQKVRINGRKTRKYR